MRSIKENCLFLNFYYRTTPRPTPNFGDKLTGRESFFTQNFMLVEGWLDLFFLHERVKTARKCRKMAFHLA